MSNANEISKLTDAAYKAMQELKKAEIALEKARIKRNKDTNDFGGEKSWNRAYDKLEACKVALATATQALKTAKESL
jgi:hypothetical protein